MGLAAVVALAGRRIDAPGATPPRFPLDAVPRVRAELTALLRPGAVRALVCSAACGADLLALDAAGRAGIERHIILPFDPARFRETSVVDRPGEWGPLFDAVIDEVTAAGHLDVGSGRPDDPGVYLAANTAILRRARSLAQAPIHSAAAASPASSASRPAAVVVWDGAPRGSDDATAQFLEAARGDGFVILPPVLTRPTAGVQDGVS